MATPQTTPTPRANNNAAAAPHDNHRPLNELRASETARQYMIRREGGVVDHYYNDQGNNCTFGAGILVRHAPCTPEELARHPDHAHMEARFNQSVATAEADVRRGIQHPLTQNQFDAMVSLAYNAGSGGAQPMFSEINRVGPEAAASRLLTTAIHVTVRDQHRRVTGHPISPGIVTRRQQELDMYLGRPIAEHPAPRATHHPAHHRTHRGAH